MKDIIDQPSIEALGRIAFELGPFFFSLLFLLVIVRWTHRCYKNANLRKDPEACTEEKKCYKTILIATYAAGLMLVFISVAWWMYAHVVKHTLQGTIIGLQRTQTLYAFSNDVFLRRTERPADITDYHFAIVRDSPFAFGEKFTFLFYPVGAYQSEEEPKPIRLNINYSGKTYEKFELISSGEEFKLKRGE